MNLIKSMVMKHFNFTIAIKGNIEFNNLTIEELQELKHLFFSNDSKIFESLPFMKNYINNKTLLKNVKLIQDSWKIDVIE